MAITVLAPAESKNLITLALVKSFLDISVTTFDTILNFLITSASDAIVDYCQREFAEETLKETIEGTSMTTIMLARTPIIEVSGISVDGVALDLVNDIVSIKDAKSGMLYRGTGFWEYRFGVPGLIELERSPDAGKPIWEFTYTAGYSLPSFTTPGDGDTLPGTVQQAALDTVISWYKSKDRDQSIQSERIADIYQVSYNNSSSLGGDVSRLPEAVRGMLSSYVRVM